MPAGRPKTDLSPVAIEIHDFAVQHGWTRAKILDWINQNAGIKCAMSTLEKFLKDEGIVSNQSLKKALYQDEKFIALVKRAYEETLFSDERGSPFGASISGREETELSIINRSVFARRVLLFLMLLRLVLGVIGAAIISMPTSSFTILNYECERIISGRSFTISMSNTSATVNRNTRSHVVLRLSTRDQIMSGPLTDTRSLRTSELKSMLQSIIATLGAIVIIAATLVDPLSQQLVQFHDCTATLP